MKKKKEKKVAEPTHPKQRTDSQNRALYLFFGQLADSLNNAGLDQRIVLKPSYQIRWTKENIHDNLWIPIQKYLYGTNSTTFLKKQEQIDKIHETIMQGLGEKFGVEYIPFPQNEEKQWDKISYGEYKKVI